MAENCSVLQILTKIELVNSTSTAPGNQHVQLNNTIFKLKEINRHLNDYKLGYQVFTRLNVIISPQWGARRKET